MKLIYYFSSLLGSQERRPSCKPRSADGVAHWEAHKGTFIISEFAFLNISIWFCHNIRVLCLALAARLRWTQMLTSYFPFNLPLHSFSSDSQKWEVDWARGESGCSKEGPEHGVVPIAVWSGEKAGRGRRRAWGRRLRLSRSARRGGEHPSPFHNILRTITCVSFLGGIAGGESSGDNIHRHQVFGIPFRFMNMCSHNSLLWCLWSHSLAECLSSVLRGLEPICFTSCCVQAL